MTQVLGTEVFDLGCVPMAVLISDLHVPADGGPVLSALQAALDAGVHRRCPVLVLGDLFDSYVSRGQVRRGVWRDVAQRFQQAAAAGAPVTVLHGNRDFLLGDEFARASDARIVRGGLRGRLGGVDTLLLHGDELCVNDVPYQRAKRWLRSAPVRWLARSLPTVFALRIAERARAKSRMVIATGDQTRFLPTQGALQAAFAIGVQRLVFGHIHRHSHGQIGQGTYWVLPAFDASAVGLFADSDSMAPVAFRPHATPLASPTPGPLTFTA